MWNLKNSDLPIIMNSDPCLIDQIVPFCIITYETNLINYVANTSTVLYVR